jgi:hypothetical protein
LSILDYSNIEEQYLNLQKQLKNTVGPAQMRAAAELMQLLAPYDAARERLNNAIILQNEVGENLFSLADFADQLGLDSTVSLQLRKAAQARGPEERIIWQTSPTKATSIKMGNFNFEFGACSEFFVGVIATVCKDVLIEANLILKALGVLMVIRSLYAAFRWSFSLGCRQQFRMLDYGADDYLAKPFSPYDGKQADGQKIIVPF